MTVFVRNKNLPLSIEDIHKMTSSCLIYNERKPRFLKPESIRGLKATQPFERFNIGSIDFKGPVLSVTNNKFILTFVDKFSRFPFVFPYSNVETKTMLTKLVNFLFLRYRCM